MNNFLLLIIIIVLIIGISYKYKKKEHLSLTVATETDQLRAQKYALKKMCEENGYSWKQFDDEFSYDCKHTEKSCLGDSVYPTKPDETPRYYEWRDRESPEYKEVVRLGSSSSILSSQIEASGDIQTGIGGDNGMCIMGLEDYRKWCEDQEFRYDTTNGQCYTTKPYCQKKLLGFCNNDCFEPPNGLILSKIFGNTIGRSLGAALGDTAVVLGCGN